MHDAFRRAGRPRRVKDEQWILGVHRLGRAVRGHRLYGFVQPHIPPVPPADISASVSDNNYGLDATRFLNRRVDIGLQWHLAASTEALVRSYDDLGFGVRDAAREGLGREAAEDDRMDRADAGASEHRVRSLGNHRQVDGDAIALLDAVALQHVGESPDLVGKLRVGDMLGL